MVTSLQELRLTRDFLQTHLQEPDFFWFMSNVFLKRPILLNNWLLHPFSTRKPHAKAVPKKDYFTHLTLKKRKKGTLSDQPRLSHVTSTALLCHWEWQLLEDMRSLGTDFRQGYIEEPAAKDFVARNARTIALSKAQGTHWNIIKLESRLGIVQKLSYDKWQSTFIHKFGNPLGIPYPSCTALVGLMSRKKVELEEFCE
jgi:hypothetical protein